VSCGTEAVLERLVAPFREDYEFSSTRPAGPFAMRVTVPVVDGDVQPSAFRAYLLYRSQINLSQAPNPAGTRS
jgi:hypothetical protein